MRSGLSVWRHGCSSSTTTLSTVVFRKLLPPLLCRSLRVLKVSSGLATACFRCQMLAAQHESGGRAGAKHRRGDGTVPGSSGSKRSKRWSQKFCNKFNKSGECSYGGDCIFRHGEHDERYLPGGSRYDGSGRAALMVAAAALTAALAAARVARMVLHRSPSLYMVTNEGGDSATWRRRGQLQFCAALVGRGRGEGCRSSPSRL